MATMTFFRVNVLAFLIITTYVVGSPDDERKPLACPENEEYHKCQLEVCFKKCQDLEKPPPCPSISPDCYQPSCECKEDYLRNDQGTCVPWKDCNSKTSDDKAEQT